MEESLADSSRGVVLFNSIVNAVVQNRGKIDEARNGDRILLIPPIKVQKTQSRKYQEGVKKLFKGG